MPLQRLCLLFNSSNKTAVVVNSLLLLEPSRRQSPPNLTHSGPTTLKTYAPRQVSCPKDYKHYVEYTIYYQQYLSLSQPPLALWYRRGGLPPSLPPSPVLPRFLSLVWSAASTVLSSIMHQNGTCEQVHPRYIHLFI